MQLLPAWQNDMKLIASAILMSLLLSCVEPEKADNISKGSNKSSSVTLKTSQTSSNLAIKNFLQVNNTYSKLTGISPNRGDIPYGTPLGTASRGETGLGGPRGKHTK